MGYIFRFNDALEYDGWYQNPKNRFAADLQDQLILELLEPVRGERVLDIGCGTGRHLLMFLEMGLDITGLDASPHMLELAKKKLGHRAELRRGFAEDLPFEDNSFEIATLVTTLEFVEDVQKTLEEACRVAKDRILLGVLNRYAIKGIERRLRGLFSESIYDEAKFFSVWELTKGVRQITGKVPLRWATAHHLPASCRKYTKYVERCSLVQRCPFGSFIAMSVTLIPRYKTRNIHIDYVGQPRGAPTG